METPISDPSEPTNTTRSRRYVEDAGWLFASCKSLNIYVKDYKTQWGNYEENVNSIGISLGGKRLYIHGEVKIDDF